MVSWDLRPYEMLSNLIITASGPWGILAHITISGEGQEASLKAQNLLSSINNTQLEYREALFKVCFLCVVAPR